MISELKKNISLVTVAENGGVTLSHIGSKYRGLCPFHTEKTPSFFVFQDDRFRCFGCNESGDVIDFVQKLHGLSFQDALKHLGIEPGRVTPEVRKEIAQRKRRAELKAQFDDWIVRYCNKVSDLLFDAANLMAGITIEDLDLYAYMYHMMPVWAYHREICIFGSEQTRYQLYKDVKKRGPKWKKIST